MSERSFIEIVDAITDPGFRRVTADEMRRVGLQLLTKEDLDCMFVEVSGMPEGEMLVTDGKNHATVNNIGHPV